MDGSSNNIKTRTLKSYFFEGIMIFVAVSLSFLAEEFREKLQETKRENKFMKSLVEDLDRDLVSLSDMAVTYGQKYLPSGDSISMFLGDYESEKIANSFYYQLRLVIRYIPLKSFVNNRTFTQLENSEGLGLIKQEEILKEIQDYYQAIETINEMEQYLFQEKQELRQILPVLLTGEGYSRLIDEKDKLVRPIEPIFAKKVSEEMKNEFLIRLSDINGLSKNIYWRLISQIELANKLKFEISKQYELNS